MVILKNSKDLLESLYNQGPAPPAIALTNLTSLPPTQLFPNYSPLKAKRQIKRINPAVF